MSIVETQSDRELQLFRASDIKQYVYCPRVIYFNYVIPVPRHRTVKMEVGQESHLDFSALEKRRSLAKYRLDEGERQFQVRLSCPSLGLTGTLDMLITSSLGLFPVEFKNSTGGMGLHHKYQLVAYAMMAEAVMGRPARTGFVYVIPWKKTYPIAITESARIHVRRICGAIANLVATGTIPKGTRSVGRCHDCEFRNYCKGV